MCASWDSKVSVKLHAVAKSSWSLCTFAKSSSWLCQYYHGENEHWTWEEDAATKPSLYELLTWQTSPITSSHSCNRVLQLNGRMKWKRESVTCKMPILLSSCSARL